MMVTHVANQLMNRYCACSITYPDVLWACTDIHKIFFQVGLWVSIHLLQICRFFSRYLITVFFYIWHQMFPLFPFVFTGHWPQAFYGYIWFDFWFKQTCLLHKWIMCLNAVDLLCTSTWTKCSMSLSLSSKHKSKYIYCQESTIALKFTSSTLAIWVHTPLSLWIYNLRTLFVNSEKIHINIMRHFSFWLDIYKYQHYIESNIICIEKYVKF